MTRLRDRLDEARNIKSEVGKVKKMVKKFSSDSFKIRGKLYADVEKIVESIDKSEDETGMSMFENEMNDMLKQFTMDHHMKEVINDISMDTYTIFWKKDR
jgi:hypothetical protein